MLPGIERGECLCDAFEAFKLQFPVSKISIEQAVLLVVALARREEIEFGACGRCCDVMIVYRLTVDPQRCASCAVASLNQCIETKSQDSNTDGGGHGNSTDSVGSIDSGGSA
jgi:hypothetical protein